MNFVRVGALRQASALCALSIGALTASTTAIAFQDMTALLSDVKPAERWQSHMVAAPQGSVHTATFQFFDQSSSYEATAFSGIRIPALPQGGLVAIAHDDGAVADDQPLVVIRATKGDLQMTRTPVAEPNRAIPESGQIWDLKDIFSTYDEADLPKVAFAAPDVGA